MSINDIIFLSLICIFCILWSFNTWLKPYYQNKHPKYRCNENMQIEYYSLFYNNWRIFYVWDNQKTMRIVKIHDTIHGIEFGHKYYGEGRESINYTLDKVLSYYTEKYKTIKEIDDEQNKLIEKENEYLKNILEINYINQ